MSLTTPLRPVSTSASPAHEHTRSCWWDHLECRWAGPAHPVPRDARLPEPRRSTEA
jgi:hypothetical protein